MQTSDVGGAAREAVAQSRSFVSDQLDTQSTKLGERVSSTADDLRKVGEQLRSTGIGSGAATLADQGAEYIERVGRYLQDSDGEALISDLEDFARERPWAVASAALVAGFAASRVLKASSARRYRTNYGTAGSSAAYDPYATPYGSGVDGATYAP